MEKKGSVAKLQLFKKVYWVMSLIILIFIATYGSLYAIKVGSMADEHYHLITTVGAIFLVIGSFLTAMAVLYAISILIDYKIEKRIEELNKNVPEKVSETKNEKKTE